MKRTTQPKAEERKEEKKMERKKIATLWSAKSKNGKFSYFTGISSAGDKLVAFNKTTKNDKAPDINIYFVNEDGKAEKEACITLWKNPKSLNGYDNDKQKVYGFFNKNKKNDRSPDITIYLSE